MSDPSPFWQSLEGRRSEGRERQDEFAEELPLGVAARPVEQSSRRDFFKVMGLSAAAAMAACQRAPTQKIIPFVRQPEGITPGLALWYASACGGCSAQCGILLKTRDGRPIKVEGNELDPVARGGVCAVGQASVLGLYDDDRARHPSVDGRAATWASIDEAVMKGLAEAKSAGRAIRLVLPWVVGPSTEAAVSRFLAAHPTARTVRYDPLYQIDAIVQAQQALYGEPRVPDYRIDRARVVASFGADFLGTWLSPVAFTRQYADARDAAGKRKMLRHWQIEPQLSLTGASADRRLPLQGSRMVAALGFVAGQLADAFGGELGRAVRASLPSLESLDGKTRLLLGELVRELRAARADALVLCGSEDPSAQLLAQACNALLENERTTAVLATGRVLDGHAVPFASFVDELKNGSVGAVLFLGVNPVYSDPRGDELEHLVLHVPLAVSTADRRDETASATRIHAPAHHALESWGDASPRAGTLLLRQPAVAPLVETRALITSVTTWAGSAQEDEAFVRERVQREVFPAAGNAASSFQAFWDESLQRGVISTAAPEAVPALRFTGLKVSAAPVVSGLELALFPSVSVRDGSMANNGWLQELPDPIAKTTWGNHVALAPSRAEQLGVSDGDQLQLTVNGRELFLPVLVQPGTHPDVLAIAVGHGRVRAGRVGNDVGQNAFRLASPGRLSGLPVTVQRTGRTLPLARTQQHASMEGRPLVKEASLEEFLANPRAGNEEEETPPTKVPLSLWGEHEYKGHRWGMAVDLSACTGCSACIVSCQAENNIPMVGQDEVLRGREMHWLRIDRYYAGEPDAPEVVHQPMMCQHCENAPCESVCPVAATVHSSEGLNQQVYNRCVGTRYCANNCPTKVRRFNWFEYKHDAPLARMVLNPDVAVRSRGVMEKCSLCLERIEEQKALAKREGRPLRDGEIRTACQQSCPAQAIHFGDLNDPSSAIAKLSKDGRAYRLLDELNIGSSITYLTKIRNRGGES